MNVLGIETSCDETSAAVLVRGEGSPGTVRVGSCVILSQDVHRVYGGVVPELASRAHLRSLPSVTDRALEDAGLAIEDVDLIAVTQGPGLIGALLVGVSYAKGLSLALGRPLVGVHHLEAHLFGTALEDPAAVPPFVGLIVSGGHSLLLDVPAWGSYRLLGETRDDAVGEAFDKVASLLDLGYPGGPEIEREAAAGDPSRFRFPRPMLRERQQPSESDYFDLSMSGLKTAVLHAVRDCRDLAAERPHLASGFQAAVIEVLVAKTVRAIEAAGRSRVVLGGGVACNRALARSLAEALAARGATLHVPSPRLAADNAAMIGAAGLFHATRGAAEGGGAGAGQPRGQPQGVAPTVWFAAAGPAGGPAALEADARLPFPGLERSRGRGGRSLAA